jgi:arsenate reductase (glutaredoxin)
MTGTVTLYHNPNCGTSRNVLAALREAGLEPRVVLYMKERLTRDELAALAAAGPGARGLLREKERLATELGLTEPAVGDAEILAAIAAHPVLFNRPVVAAESRAFVCRPASRLEAFLNK